MLQYRKKPIVIEAVHYQQHGDTVKESFNLVPDWLKDAFLDNTLFRESHGCPLECKTLEGSLVVPIGAWIICGIEGELYPIDADIFKKTYELVK